MGNIFGKPIYIYVHINIDNIVVLTTPTLMPVIKLLYHFSYKVRTITYLVPM